jgi:Family of unknown function (DUF5678)
MSSAIVERILEEVKRLTADEQRELREALAREPQPAPAYDTHERERAWIESHRDEYFDQWVALDGDRLLAHGTDAREVYLAARAAGVVVPYVERVKPNDGLPFGGW